jgi:hypothetical protein
MAEQIGLALLFGPEPPRHGLRRRVFAVDAMDDPVEFEAGERPVDRRPRRLDRIALAAKLTGDAPADFKTGPAWRKSGSYSPDEFAGGFFLDHKHADATQDPMSGHDGRIAPPDQLVGDGLSVGGDESRGTWIGQHRRVRRDVGAAPLPQLQTLGLDDGTGKHDAGLEGSDHRFPRFFNDAMYRSLSAWPGLSRPSMSFLLSDTKTGMPGTRPGLTNFITKSQF